jgi:DNA polymerase-3 subunit epsilon
MEARRRLSGDDEAELKRLWRDLVKLYHPDRYASEPDKQATYTKLTGAINEAKDNCDLETLRKIAADPQAYVMRRGWAAIDFREDDDPDELQKLLHSLEAEMLAVIEATDSLKRSPSYKLYQATEDDADELDRAVTQQIAAITKDIEQLETEAETLRREIAELAGEEHSQVG